MRILGIDPGIGRVGWAVVEAEKGQITPLAYDCFETEPNTPIAPRLEKIFSHMHGLLKEHNPEVLVIEELFFNTNAKTALTVGHARGVILLAAAQNHIEITSYTPLQVKMAITGYGRADKKQIGQMVKTLLKLEKVPKLDDTTDALAIAMTHVYLHKMGKFSR